MAKKTKTKNSKSEKGESAKKLERELRGAKPVMDVADLAFGTPEMGAALRRATKKFRTRER